MLHPEAQIRLVVAVLPHRLLVAHARKWLGDLHPEHLPPQRGHQLLDDGEDVVLGDEGHLQVDLRELRLAIETQVLVAEALDDLEVPLEARHHEQLLEQLRTLRQRVELPGVQPRGHEKVSRAAGRVLHEVRSLELEEAEAVQRLPGDGVHLAALHQRLLQRSAAEVEVAVAEPLVLGGVELVLDQERRRLAAVEDRELGGVHLDLAGDQARVHVAAARDHLSANADAELVAQLLRQVVHLLALLRFEDHLRQPGPVAQVDEHGAPVVAPVVHPSEEDHFLADVARRELAAGVGALQIANEFGHDSSSKGRSG